jgi:hypothetical protein
MGTPTSAKACTVLFGKETSWGTGGTATSSVKRNFN